MPKVLVVYFSRGGNTRRMAEAVGQGVAEAEMACETKAVDEADITDLLEADAIVLGSPTYYGQPAADLKQLIDDSVRFHGKLNGKVGGAFASCGVFGGGVETTLHALNNALLIHGMVIQGTPRGGHFGAVSVGAPDDTALSECRNLGKRVAELTRKLT